MGKTDVGKRRKQNEDCIFVSNKPVGNLPNLYIVADGMGGHKSGEVASQMVIESFCDYVEKNKSVHILNEEELFIFLKQGVSYANQAVYEKAQTDETLMGMGTTLTLCTLRDNFAYVAHVGDSRLYVHKKQWLKQVTVDHSVIQELLDKGGITEQEVMEHPKRHMITRAVGTYNHVKTDVLKYPLGQVDHIMLCSDGLTTMIKDNEICELLDGGEVAEKQVEALIEQANRAGGYDNIATIIIKQSEVKS